jgi:hypothetical protein
MKILFARGVLVGAQQLVTYIPQLMLGCNPQGRLIPDQ